MFIDCNRLCMDFLFQESQYPGYSNYWYPQSHTAGPYGNTYPPGTEVNRQASYNPQVLQTFQAYITTFVSQIHSRLTPLHSAVPFSGNVSLSQWGVQSRTVLHEYATSLQPLLLQWPSSFKTTSVSQPDLSWAKCGGFGSSPLPCTSLPRGKFSYM